VGGNKLNKYEWGFKILRQPHIKPDTRAVTAGGAIKYPQVLMPIGFDYARIPRHITSPQAMPCQDYQSFLGQQ